MNHHTLGQHVWSTNVLRVVVAMECVTRKMVSVIASPAFLDWIVLLQYAPMTAAGRELATQKLQNVYVELLSLDLTARTPLVRATAA